MPNEEDCRYKSQKPNVKTIEGILEVLKKSIGIVGDNVGLLNCENGIISLTSDSNTIISSFQVFY